MPAALDRYYTREEVLAFPKDGNRYELVHGELLVSPSPRTEHQRAVLRLAVAVEPYVRRHALGELFISPADITFGGLSDVLVQPDLFVVAPHTPAAEGWDDMRHFVLFIEVLSPSASRYDRFTKRRLYQEMRVPLYWIVDPENRRAEIWTPDAVEPRFEAARLIWHPEGAAEPLTVHFDELFTR